MLKKHVSHAHRKKQTTTADIETTLKQIRPIRVAAKRQREYMVVIARQENAEDVEWMDEEELDLVGIDNFDSITVQAKNQMPIISIEEHCAVPWTNEEE
jgi:hypothetical protein